MVRWKKLGWVGLAGCGLIAILLIARFGWNWHSSAPANQWNSRAIQSTLAGVRVRELDPTHAAVIFSYDLDNSTDSDYRLASGPNVVIMSRLPPNGSLSSDEPISLDSAAFVPAKNRTRISLEISHAFDWPTQKDATAERQIRQFPDCSGVTAVADAGAAADRNREAGPVDSPRGSRVSGDGKATACGRRG